MNPNKAKAPQTTGPNAKTKPEPHQQFTRWAQVPGEILGLKITRQELRCFIAMSMDANDDRLAWTSQRTLAERIGCARRSVQMRLLPGLEERDLIRRVGVSGRSTVYLVAPYPIKMDASERVHTRGKMDAFSAKDGRILKTEWTHSQLRKRALTEVTDETEADAELEGSAPPPQLWLSPAGLALIDKNPWGKDLTEEQIRKEPAYDAS